MSVPLAIELVGRLGSGIEDGVVDGTTDDCIGEELCKDSVVVDCWFPRLEDFT
jgi:hypothetical protein